MWCCTWRNNVYIAGSLNKKMPSYQYRDPHGSLMTVLCLTWETHAWKDGLYYETRPGLWTQERCPIFVALTQSERGFDCEMLSNKIFVIVQYYDWTQHLCKLSMHLCNIKKHVINIVQGIVWLHSLISDQSHIKWYLLMIVETDPCFDSLLFYLLF